jgi:hypothetical protein
MKAIFILQTMQFCDTEWITVGFTTSYEEAREFKKLSTSFRDCQYLRIENVTSKPLEDLL